MGLVYALGALGSLVGAPINGALLGTGSEFAWAKSIVFTGVSAHTCLCLVKIEKRMGVGGLSTDTRATY